ncbi:30S ribosomal protein S12 methylthiotransferase RimO [Deferribacter autotrophicus]|uniref:Ribosomal protein uS12 methylthiotransferase RimO n=1 Tax=Deferribacter autotrophicus TaxID=500465 RepID=A0A5A8F568_9BACT|nr:30S ribosomal protein S12 methylthiotransferase RimO [Deferribacter autotrophicus]KAA0258646.1 30S ribosomal protein S12 methylthiotransferase RimO [Deferribacter autotrophicus]
MKVAAVSLGCPKNQVDLEVLLGKMVEENFEITNSADDADVIIINTCGFIEPAVMEAVETILEFEPYKEKGKKIVVTGCMVERYKDEFEKEFPFVDYYAGVGELKSVLMFLKDGIEGEKEKNLYFTKNRLILNPKSYAYLKVADGCINRCSYCTIPSIRGTQKSREIEDILDEAKKLISSGIKELILISQDTTKYGLDIYGEFKLKELVRRIHDIDGDFYIRLLYLNPDGVDEELIDMVLGLEKVINYFEIPVQHINDRILKLMNRKSDSKKIRSIFSKIREKSDEAFIRTTFIVGFPSETEEEWSEIKDFLEEYKPDYAGFFPFYREDGVKASMLEPQIGKREKNRRVRELQKIQKKITMERLKSLKKREIICFAEKANEDFDFILEGRALFQTPDIDGKVYFIDGEATDGMGPYLCKIKRVVYPDLYCKIESKL